MREYKNVTNEKVRNELNEMNEEIINNLSNIERIENVVRSTVRCVSKM